MQNQNTETVKQRKALEAIKSNVLWSVGAGLLPIPVADVLALTTVQLKLIAELADIYGVPFSRESGKAIVGALLGGTSSSVLATGTGSFLKLIPIVGQTVGACALSIYAAAVTYAVGQLFNQHFRSGGTMLDFNPEKMRERFLEFYHSGVERLRRSGTKAVSADTDSQDPPAV